ncbi:2-succinyl-5-enolpyruvyl-6-hydroxy-3-cyclohexene-1-carboxylic-acid synthase [Labilibaculum sp. A4]|uniref:2-succinyl-5-enolpyruvyl-6-hydroxy-3- cyclohexene-1-carboxylic-acid synthase n=1 Tax=Labilibaculum euxinus TaxID=2686357 RepID=UPI000F61B809|nr:2-succinyl-5-enolpyruvyl-6-hydroxy-3-cyclohexene-1-carboxylic-acid synthase [Labilibaculum euxinus]MDQ1771809.1 2-succinyl-5-enolpyruvyl-6-hydroxy-3-cyclohexene-1-carboxylic-acid synthase [Labilibaculum euxinus]MWN77712.1 2-succinyl-5-enolpyruvyl-6-hydroxy-3-cyclohexene-1-carboxylic-acid synthase [Labilibaculum euxinus]
MERNYSDIKGVKELIDICWAKGMEYVIVSPGSRNAPLSISFAKDDRIKSLVIVDERSAGYFALGIAQQTRKPVGLVCTSGTALLNYGPAVAEAFYQRLPLVVISADRPVEWIGQDDSQALPQVNVFGQFVKASYQLPLDANNPDDCWYLNRMVNEALSKAQSGRLGPVHINFPLREPLYGVKPYPNSIERVIGKINSVDELSADTISSIAAIVNSNQKIVILAGLLHPQAELNELLAELAQNKNVVILTESVSNLHNKEFLPCIDRVICSIKDEELDHFKPDLLINFGGPLVSKMIKSFLRNNKPKEHWFVGKEDHFIDTFKNLTSHIDVSPLAFFKQLLPLIKPSDSSFSDCWKCRDAEVSEIHSDYLKNIEWSDLKVFEQMLHAIPEGGNLQLANSSVVRYAQLFKTSVALTYNSNRGTSGIDGCTSTAAGAALVNGKTTTLITGDISFFYDSNALWNKYLQPNFKIILINNGGGGIFRFISGPSGVDELEEYFETVQDYKAGKLAETFGLDYFYAENQEEVNRILPNFYAVSNRAAILEIKTPRTVNDQVLINYFKTIKSKV